MAKKQQITGLIVRYLAGDPRGGITYGMRIFTVPEAEQDAFRQKTGKAYTQAIREIAKDEAAAGRRYWETVQVI